MSASHALVNKLTTWTDAYLERIKDEMSSPFNFEDPSQAAFLHSLAVTVLEEIKVADQFRLPCTRLISRLIQRDITEYNVERDTPFSSLAPATQRTQIAFYLSKLLTLKFLQGHRSALLDFIGNTFGENSAEFKKIQLTYDKLHTTKELQQSLHGGTNQAKVVAYEEKLSEKADTLSEHRNPPSERLGAPILLIILTLPIALVILFGALVYRAMENRLTYGHYNIFSPRSKDLMDGATKAIGEYKQQLTS